MASVSGLTLFDVEVENSNVESWCNACQGDKVA